MKALVCEMCGSQDLIKQNGMYVCQHCGTKYSVEEAKKLMIEGTVDVQGTVKIDNSSFVEKYLTNARRAYTKGDWAEVEKYYNMVEQNAPDNMEAVFFSSYGKAMNALINTNYYEKGEVFEILIRSMSVINDYFETTTENKEEVLRRINDGIAKMYTVTFVCNPNKIGINSLGSRAWHIAYFDKVRYTFAVELYQIYSAHPDLAYIIELYNKNYTPQEQKGCYIATCVYGSYDCPEVWTLRRYRDYTLAEKWYGRAFIHTYYAISPTLVKWFGKTKWFRNMWKPKLDRMVSDLNKKGVADTPYQDKEW